MMPDKFIAWRNDYNAEKYDRYSLMLPKGAKEELKQHAATRGESLNAFINRAIAEQYRRDTAATEATEPQTE